MLIETRQIFLHPLNDLITEKNCFLASLQATEFRKVGKVTTNDIRSKLKRRVVEEKSSKHQYDMIKSSSVFAILIERRQIFLRRWNDLITEKNCSLASVADNRV